MNQLSTGRSLHADDRHSLRDECRLFLGSRRHHVQMFNRTGSGGSCLPGGRGDGCLQIEASGCRKAVTVCGGWERLKNQMDGISGRAFKWHRLGYFSMNSTIPPSAAINSASTFRDVNGVVKLSAVHPGAPSTVIFSRHRFHPNSGVPGYTKTGIIQSVSIEIETYPQ